jgi:Protein of unknown function (DUF3352)
MSRLNDGGARLRPSDSASLSRLNDGGARLRPSDSASLLRTATATAVALAVFAAGCGDDGESAATGAGAAIPADALVYAEADISGEGDQHAKLDSLLTELGEIPLLGTPIEPRDLIAQALEDSAADYGLDFSYAEDVEPWLGDSAAVGYTSVEDPDPTFVVSIAVDDETLARDAVERTTAEDRGEETEAEYDGVSYLVSESGDYAVGVFDGMLVLTTADEFEAAVDAARGDSIAEDDAVGEALAALPEERLGALWVDVEAAVESGGDSPEAQADLDAVREAAPELLEPVAAAAVAGERTLALDVAVPHGEDAPDFSGTGKLAEAPSDSFAALGFAAFGEQLGTILDRVESFGGTGLVDAFEGVAGVPLDDVLAGIGDAVAYGRGSLPEDFVVTMDAGLTGESDAPEQALDGLRQLAEEDQDTVVGPALGDGTGFSAEPTPAVANTSPIRFINAELGEELSLIAAGDRQAAEATVPTDTLADTERFQAASEAITDDFDLVGFADLEPILDSFVPGGSILDLAIGDVPPEQAALGFLADKLGFAAAGIREDGDYTVQRLLVGLR